MQQNCGNLYMPVEEFSFSPGLYVFKLTLKVTFCSALFFAKSSTM